MSATLTTFLSIASRLILSALRALTIAIATRPIRAVAAFIPFTASCLTIARTGVAVVLVARTAITVTIAMSRPITLTMAGPAVIAARTTIVRLLRRGRSDCIVTIADEHGFQSLPETAFHARSERSSNYWGRAC